MNIEANRRLARRMIEEVLNANDETARKEVVHPDFYDPTNPPGMQHGPKGNRQIVELFHRSFPDVRWDILTGFDAGDALRIARRREPLTVRKVVAGTEVATGEDKASVTVDVPPGTPPGEYTLAILGQAQVPYSKDPKAAQRPNVLVALPARPVTLVVTPKK